MISERLKAALHKEEQAQKEAAGIGTTETPAIQEHIEEKERVIETTQEEMEGFYIIKSILRKQVDPNRITYRDAQTYMAILLDDNNRRTICRLYFNGSKKSIALLNSEKKEVKHEIRDLDDIYQHVDGLRSTVETYLELKA